MLAHRLFMGAVDQHKVTLAKGFTLEVPRFTRSAVVFSDFLVTRHAGKTRKVLENTSVQVGQFYSRV